MFKFEKSPDTEDLRYSFCNKPQKKVEKLISNPDTSDPESTSVTSALLFAGRCRGKQ